MPLANLVDRIRVILDARRARRHGDPEHHQLCVLVQPGQTAVDVGANHGVYTRSMLLCGARVHAIEPNPVLAGRLRRAGFGQLQVHEMAAGAEAGDAELYVPRHRKGRQNDPGGRLIDTDHADGWRYRVAVNTLDAMNFGPVAFMKIDVEGFEEAALDGAWTTIERDRPALLVELEERILSGCRQRTVERLSSLGYRAWFLDNGRWNPEAELAEDQKGSSGRYINNFLFWPHEGLPPLAMPRPGNR